MPPSDLEQKSPMEIYLDRLILRFKLHRANLRCTPPAGAVQALSKDHPTSCEATKASYSWWHRLLRATDPLPVQLSAMDQETALRLIRLITQNGFLKRDKTFDSRVSRWIWALLGRIEDVGIMESKDVGIIRDLGKRAVWVVEGLKERERRDVGADVEEIESGELDDVEEYMDTDETKEEGGILGGDTFEPSLGGEHAICMNATPETDQTAAMPKDEELEEGEISDSPKKPTDETTADELEAAKTRLMARVSAAERSDTVADGANGGEKAGEEEILIEGEEYWERMSNVRGTLNMIITVVGELYGQRDLLKHRDLLWELAD
jgi:Survival motor neuron (SMN) interacting protein 1 (SIP1)